MSPHSDSSSTHSHNLPIRMGYKEATELSRMLSGTIATLDGLLAAPDTRTLDLQAFNLNGVSRLNARLNLTELGLSGALSIVGENDRNPPLFRDTLEPFWNDPSDNPSTNGDIAIQIWDKYPVFPVSADDRESEQVEDTELFNALHALPAKRARERTAIEEYSDTSFASMGMFSSERTICLGSIVKTITNRSRQATKKTHYITVSSPYDVGKFKARITHTFVNEGVGRKVNSNRTAFVEYESPQPYFANAYLTDRSLPSSKDFFLQMHNAVTYILEQKKKARFDFL